MMITSIDRVIVFLYILPIIQPMNFLAQQFFPPRPPFKSPSPPVQPPPFQWRHLIALPVSEELPTESILALENQFEFA